MIDLDELEILAKAATPGPWFVSDDYTGIVVENNGLRVAAAYSDKPYEIHDAAFISAFNPSVAQELINRLLEAEKGLSAVDTLINNSEGVAGLHLNGDIAPWNELRTGGRFEGWLIDFDAAMEQGNEYSANRGRV